MPSEALPALYDEFVLSERTRDLSKNTVKGRAADFVAICDILAANAGLHSRDELTVDHLGLRDLRLAFGDFADTHKAASILRAWATWNTFINFLVADDYMEGNPMAGIKKPKEKKPTPKAITKDGQVERLLELLLTTGRPARDPWPEMEAAFIITDLLTGLRLSELLAANIGDITGPDGHRYLSVIGKGDKARSVPIEPELELVLAPYLESRKQRFPSTRIGRNAPLFVDRQGERLKEGAAQYFTECCYRAVGIPTKTGALVHALRHTFATRLAQNGAGVRSIQELLGHESIVTSQRYIDSLPEDQRSDARGNRTYDTLQELLGVDDSDETREGDDDE